MENGKIINSMKSRILPIAEDASFRKFYRLISSKSSKIIVLSNREKYKNLVAYTAINKFLRANKMLAPKLYGYNFSKGIIVIQDFGNFTFYKIDLGNKKIGRILRFCKSFFKHLFWGHAILC